MRDRADNCVIICSIENVDPMGVHTGDSITVAPQQTLTDVEYQQMRDAAIACIRGSASRPAARTCSSPSTPTTGRQVVIEMNPRVSRSSALASKATGFPIAKIAAKLAVGLHARRDPERHHQGDAGQLRADDRLRRHQDPALGVREVPGHRRCARHADAVGRRGDGDRPDVPRVAPEGRCARSSRAGSGSNCDPASEHYAELDDDELLAATVDRRPPTASSRSESSLRRGVSIEAIHEADRLRPVVPRPDVDHRRGAGRPGRAAARRDDGPATGRRAKRLGLRRRPARLAVGRRRGRVRAPRGSSACVPTYKTVDTCSAEFAAETPYHYSTYEDESEVAPERPAEGRDPRLGPEPDRPGDRVRLLLRPRQLRAARGRATRR